MDKMSTYILNNWNRYGIEAIKSRKDMARLLAFFDYIGYSFELMHEDILNGCDFIGGTMGLFENDNAYVNYIFENVIFFDTMAEAFAHILDYAMYCNTDIDDVCNDFAFSVDDIKQSNGLYFIDYRC